MFLILAKTTTCYENFNYGSGNIHSYFILDSRVSLMFLAHHMPELHSAHNFYSKKYYIYPTTQNVLNCNTNLFRANIRLFINISFGEYIL